MRGKIRCRYHGGKSTGPSPKTHLYSRHLPEGVLDAFTDADIESLDEELRLAKAKLDWAVARWSESPKGGVPVGVLVTRGEKHVRIRLWTDIVGEHSEHVRRLSEARAKLRTTRADDEEDLKSYEAWVNGVMEASPGSDSEES